MYNILNLSEFENFWLFEMLPFRQNEKSNYKFVRDYQEFCIEKGIFGIGWSDYEELKDIFGTIKTKNGKIENDEEKKKLKENIENIIKDFDFNKSDIGNISKIYQDVYNEIGKINKKDEKEKEEEEEENKVAEKEEENKKEENKSENNGLKRAIDNFFSIKKGDVVLSRLRNGKYIVGRVIDDEKEYGRTQEEEEILNKYNVKSQGFGWRCNVDWHIISREDVPSDIIGRCSQRNPSTLTHINNDRIKLFTLKLLKQSDKTIKIDCPPIILNKNNFASSLNSDELEDLVYLYILKENNNLTLLPSLCKISEPLYEFFLQDNDGKYITCQVKNNSVVEFLIYKDEMDKDKEKKIKKIYLFSGIGKYFKDEDKEKYDEFKNNYEEKITEIDKKELWKILNDKKQYFKFSQKQTKDYYDIKDVSDEKGNTIVFLQEITNNDWKMHISGNHLKGKKRFDVEFYNDNGEILYASKVAKKACDNKIGIERKKVYKINFMYKENEKDINFYYNNEFKCFIIKNPESEIKNIIDEVRPIVEKITGE